MQKQRALYSHIHKDHAENITLVRIKNYSTKYECLILKTPIYTKLINGSYKIKNKHTKSKYQV